MMMGPQREREAGFTLIELVVVLAILAILAAVVIPRYSSVQQESRIKADATTAAAIIDAARVQELNTGRAVNSLDKLDRQYFIIQELTPQSGGEFELTKIDNVYKVRWTAAEQQAGAYAGTYVVTEGMGVPDGALYREAPPAQP